MLQTATGIIDAFDELIAGGADYNGVLEGMQDEIGAVVRNSLKFGTEIPANMKPWIEELAKSGRLLDDNGEKITDTSKLKFGGEIKKGLDDVVLKLQEMIDLMTKGLPGGAAAAATGVNTELAKIKDRTVKIVYQTDGIPGGFRIPMPTPSVPGSGAAAFTVGGALRMGAVRAATPAQHITVMLGRRALLSTTVEGLPRELVLQGR